MNLFVVVIWTVDFLESFLESNLTKISESFHLLYSLKYRMLKLVNIRKAIYLATSDMYTILLAF